MSQYVVWYDSSETGAPTLNNAAGSLIGVLDACLVTGFGTRTLTSLVVAGGVATGTFAGHGFSGTYGKDIRVAGATPSGLNGRKELTYVDTNTFRFDATGIADGTATGTITAKRDPLGWTKQYSGTNKAMYKRSDVTAAAMMLRVLDTAAAPATTTDARVFMVESATDVDTYTGQAPVVGSLADGQFWNKGANTATAKQWALIGDGKFFYLWTQYGTTLLPAGSHALVSHVAFGDFPSLKSGDAYNCIISGHTATQAGLPSATFPMAGGSTAGAAGDNSFVIARNYAQTGSAVAATILAVAPSGTVNFAASPSVVDSGFAMANGIPILDKSTTPSPVRGYMPGLYHYLNNMPSLHYTVIPDAVGVGGRKIVSMAWSTGGTAGVAGFDLTGPWR